MEFDPQSTQGQDPFDKVSSNPLDISSLGARLGEDPEDFTHDNDTFDDPPMGDDDLGGDAGLGVEAEIEAALQKLKAAEAIKAGLTSGYISTTLGEKIDPDKFNFAEAIPNGEYWQRYIAERCYPLINKAGGNIPPWALLAIYGTISAGTAIWTARTIVRDIQSRVTPDDIIDPEEDEPQTTSTTAPPTADYGDPGPPPGHTPPPEDPEDIEYEESE